MSDVRKLFSSDFWQYSHYFMSNITNERVFEYMDYNILGEGFLS